MTQKIPSGFDFDKCANPPLELLLRNNREELRAWAYGLPVGSVLCEKPETITNILKRRGELDRPYSHYGWRLIAQSTLGFGTIIVWIEKVENIKG